MKIKKQYIIAVFFIIASLIYLLVRNDSQVNYEIPRFAGLDKDEITAISMISKNQSLELKKQGETWTIEPEGHKADMSQVNRLLSESVNLSIVDLISSREDYSRYELSDEKGLSVSISTAEGPARKFKLGKSSSTAIYTYIRLPQQQGIYSVQGNLKNVFSLTVDKWRDKQVLDFDSLSAGALEVSQRGESITFIKTTVTETPGWSRDGEVIENSSEMDNNMKTLSMLKTTGYLEGDISGPAQVEIKITTPSGVHTLQIFEKLEKGYGAKSSDVDGSFLIPVYIGDMIIKL